MKSEYDFSQGEQGKFYHPNSKFNFPIDLKNETYIEDLVKEYQQNQRQYCYSSYCDNEFYYCDEDHSWWGDKKLSWEETIKRAWDSITRQGKMHPHQRRIGRQKLFEGLSITFKNCQRADQFENFDQIYEWIRSISLEINGIGPLTTYDVATRLGMWLGFKPEFVYLHAGAKEGAKALGIKGEKVKPSEFPASIQTLEVDHIESFLCVYKDKLKTWNEWLTKRMSEKDLRGSHPSKTTSKSENDFDEVINYVLEKNQELYQRLA